MNTKKAFVQYIRVFVYTFLIMSIILLLSEFSSEMESDFQDGQRFQLNGNGKLYVEGKDCNISFIQPKSEVVFATQKNNFGIYESVIEVNGKVEGELSVEGMGECTIKAWNLESEFYPNFSFSSIFYKMFLSFLMTSSTASVFSIIFMIAL